MKILTRLVILISLFLCACAMTGPINMQILQKDNSKIHYAVWEERSLNSGGFIEIQIGEKTYRGNPVRVSEADLFGLKSKTSSFSRMSDTGSIFTTYYRALLANDDGIGMRCDFYIHLRSGSGLCIDEANKQYDISMIF